MIDVKLSLREHLEYACQKVRDSPEALTKMSPNIGGLKTLSKIPSSQSGTIHSSLFFMYVSEGAGKLFEKKTVEFGFKFMALRVSSPIR